MLGPHTRLATGRWQKDAKDLSLRGHDLHFPCRWPFVDRACRDSSTTSTKPSPQLIPMTAGTLIAPGFLVRKLENMTLPTFRRLAWIERNDWQARYHMPSFIGIEGAFIVKRAVWDPARTEIRN